MTKMPPEMSTTITPTIALPVPQGLMQQQQQQQQQHESLSALHQTRSRFMINDILAGSALQQPQQVQTAPPHVVLQHYLAQQQQQQHQQQQQQQHKQFTMPILEPRHFQHPYPVGHPYQLTHMPPTAALMGLTPVGMQNIQHERDLENSSAILDFDERSRSPPSHASGAEALNRSHNVTSSNSVNGDQASTIDDSDSGKEDDGSSKSDNMMGLSKKQRKARTAFTDHQLQILEKSFERQKYLSVQDRMELANKLELSDCQVKTWYQNRRTKWKRQTAVGLELLAEAGNYAAFQRLYGASSPYLNSWPYSTPAAPASAIDLYYRQAAAAATLQKPLSYRLYGNMPTISPMMPAPNLPHMGGYYHPGVNASLSPNGMLPVAPRPQTPQSLETTGKHISPTPSPDLTSQSIPKTATDEEDDDAIEV